MPPPATPTSTAAVLVGEARRVLRRFGPVAAAWSSLLAATAPSVDAPEVLWAGIALIWGWALATQLLPDDRRGDLVWWSGWLTVAVGTELLGPAAGTAGWSVAGGATLLVLVAAAGTGRRAVVGLAVAALSVAALARGLLSDDWSVGGSVGAVLLFAFAGLALAWLSRVLLAALQERDALREELTRARQAEAAADARAEAAATLHDTVLQQLAVVGRADDLEGAHRAATRASADLRTFLRHGATVEDTLQRAVAAAVTAAADGAELTVAGAGDAPMDDASVLLVGAAAEAVRNAVRHGTPPISVYTEVTATVARCWVRDAGLGFDPAAAPPDRLGVRDSIVGRLDRAGGSATLQSGPSGCEWELVLPR